MVRQRRADDIGTLCWIAMRCSQVWDWIDKRAIDKHIISLVVLYGTWRVTEWGMGFAAASSVSGNNGIEAAAMIAAVTAPYMALQAAAIAFYFKART